MDRETFERHLIEASEVVLPFSRQFLVDMLPDSCLYLIFPNASYDGNPLIGDEQVFPEDALAEGEYLGPYSVEQVVDFLFRNGKVPEWINVMVHSTDADFTYVKLMCCGRYTAQDEYLYHRPEGFPPFHGLGPNMPSNWESVERDGQFHLNWFENRKKTNR